MVKPSHGVKYINVWMDDKLNLHTHVKKTIEKGEKSVATLTRLMPNKKGPDGSQRWVLGVVV